jgi:hypothetical protein
LRNRHVHGPVDASVGSCLTARAGKFAALVQFSGLHIEAIAPDDLLEGIGKVAKRSVRASEKPDGNHQAACVRFDPPGAGAIKPRFAIEGSD